MDKWYRVVLQQRPVQRGASGIVSDGKTLYFASDMPGAWGQSDLFKVTINPDGSYGTPENLGKTINTERRPPFPFISSDNELYYSSDGRSVLGELDVFVNKIGKDGSFRNPRTWESLLTEKQTILACW